LPNIDEHNKANSVFSRICLVPRASGVLFDDEKHTVESMIHGHHEYISKLLLESELDLLKCYNIDVLTSILTQTIEAQLTLLRTPHVTKQENWQKLWQIGIYSSNSPKFFTIR